MAQRREPPDSLDFFPTPPWATRALCEHVLWGLKFGGRPAETCWEPACGEGHMARPLAEYFGTVHASDIHDYGYGAVGDFLGAGLTPPWSPPGGVDWIVMNPPFRLATDFALRARGLQSKVGWPGVAMLVRTSFLESADRYERLFKPWPPLVVAPFVERVPMVKGRYDPKASTATSYAWVVWLGRNGATMLRWIPPCRADLARSDDYGHSRAPEADGNPLFEEASLCRK